jgi:HSP20 family molecular chaperone IbpA
MSTTLARRINVHPGLLGRGVFDDLCGWLNQDIPQYIQQSTTGYPVADIYGNDDGATIMEFALAGFTREEISIEVKPEKRAITVSATTNASADQSENRRIARRNFTKTYVNYDDNLDLTAAAAKYENGLLTVTVPMRPEAQPVTISIS